MNRPDRQRYPETTSPSCARSSYCLPRARLLFLSFQGLGRRLDATSCSRPHFPGRQCKAQINHHVLVLVPIPIRIMMLDPKVFTLPGCGVLLPKLKYLELRRLRQPFCTEKKLLHTRYSYESIPKGALIPSWKHSSRKSLVPCPRPWPMASEGPLSVQHVCGWRPKIPPRPLIPGGVGLAV